MTNQRKTKKAASQAEQMRVYYEKCLADKARVERLIAATCAAKRQQRSR